MTFVVHRVVVVGGLRHGCGLQGNEPAVVYARCRGKGDVREHISTQPQVAGDVLDGESLSAWNGGELQLALVRGTAPAATTRATTPTAAGMLYMANPPPSSSPRLRHRIARRVAP